MNANDFEQELRRRIHGIDLTLDPPRTESGTWFIDARTTERALVIECRPESGFGLSDVREDPLYGESLPDEFFRDGQRALNRAIELLTTENAGSSASLRVRSTAHDLRNVFAAIRSSSEQLLKTDPNARLDAQAILEATSAGETLAGALLAVERPSTPTAFDPDVRIRALTPVLRSVVRGQISLEIDLNAATRAFGAESGFDQALLNLVMNARDAMPAGGTLRIATSQTSQGFVVTVTDTGTGIRSDIAARVFEPFFTTKENGKGTGLGLASARSFARSAGGDITFESSNSGTTFRLALPRALGTSAAVQAVLIVDDDDLLRASLARALIADGFDVLTAASAEEALTALRARPDVGVAVVDVHMPNVTGFELAQKFQEQGLAIRVIFMSGAPDARVQADIRSKPFLAKPFANEELARRVRIAASAA